MIDKHATMMTDEEIIEEHKELSQKRKMRKLVNMNLHISEENKLHDLIEEINHRGLDALRDSGEGSKE